MYRGKKHEQGYECNYCFLTGHSRLARTTPEQRAAGECPVRAVGKRKKGVPQKGLARSYPYKADRVLLRTLYDRGLSDGEIGRTAGCSASAVYYWRHANDLPANTSKGGWHPRRTGEDPPCRRCGAREGQAPPLQNASAAQRCGCASKRTSIGMNEPCRMRSGRTI